MQRHQAVGEFRGQQTARQLHVRGENTKHHIKFVMIHMEAAKPAIRRSLHGRQARNVAVDHDHRCGNRRHADTHDHKTPLDGTRR